MKINIKDVFEKDSGDVRIHTNNRLDMEQVFAEALAEDTDKNEAMQEPVMSEPEAVEQPEPERDEAGKAPAETEGQYGEALGLDIREEPVQAEQAEEEQPEAAEPRQEEQSEAAKAAESEESAEPIAEAEDAAAPEESAGLIAEAGEAEASEESTGLIAEAEEAEASEESAEPAAEAGEAAESEENAEPAAEAEEAKEPEEDAAAQENEELKQCAEETEPAASEEKPEKEAGQPLYKRYGWHAGITAAFIAIIAVVIVYTTMIPREVNATINGEELTFSSKAHTVEGFLEEENIDFCEEDYISVSPEAFIYDGIALEINHATDFKVTADGKTKKYKSLANTVGDALKDVDVKVGDNDIVKPGIDAMLTKDLEIVIQRVEIKESVEEEEVPFKTVNKDDSSLDEGTTKVVTEGVKGKDKVTYEITYIDGKEASRKEINREHVTAAVDKVVANGTRISYNGQSYSRKLVVKAYAYTGGGRTAMGTRARVGEIAVDPSVIPLGTNVYIEGVGARRAEDTGGNIQGNTIDIYMNTQSECINWGARYVTIYIQ